MGMASTERKSIASNRPKPLYETFGCTYVDGLEKKVPTRVQIK